MLNCLNVHPIFVIQISCSINNCFEISYYLGPKIWNTETNSVFLFKGNNINFSKIRFFTDYILTFIILYVNTSCYINKNISNFPIHGLRDQLQCLYLFICSVFLRLLTTINMSLDLDIKFSYIHICVVFNDVFRPIKTNSPKSYGLRSTVCVMQQKFSGIFLICIYMYNR